MENYGMFFAGMLAMALLSGLIVFLFVRPWIRPIRRSLEASHETITENFHLSAAQVKRQTAEEQNRANQAAITAERSRQERILVETENDQLEEARRRAASRQDDADEQIEEIEEAIKVEDARAKLRWARIQNDQCALPPPWKIKRQYIIGSVALVLLFVLAMFASIYFSK